MTSKEAIFANRFSSRNHVVLGRVHFSLAGPCHAEIRIINGTTTHLVKLYNEIAASLAAVTNNRHVPLSHRSGFPCCALCDGRPRW